jgi:hypothetical protein
MSTRPIQFMKPTAMLGKIARALRYQHCLVVASALGSR